MREEEIGLTHCREPLRAGRCSCPCGDPKTLVDSRSRSDCSKSHFALDESASCPDVILTQVYLLKDFCRLELWRCVVMLFAEISVAEGVEADEVLQSWIAIRSKDWILTETEVGLSFLEAVIKNQLDLRVLEDKHDQGDRRRLQFRDAVAVRCDTKFDDWFNLDGRITKGFLKSIPQRFNSYDQADVSNLAKVKQIAHRIIQDEHDVRKNPKHLGYSCLEFVLNQTTDVSGAASTTVFNRRYVQTRRAEAVV